MQTADKIKVLQLFNKLSKPEQVDVFEKISEQTFSQRWKMIDTELPNANISEEDIMEEVRAVRYGSKKD
jgi:16S rRNA A1518/A1519 N6-dimethyltransferase RsmA/KsgA/DIM1 with predicted DNA glycosylase/AP lyase activity